ncbi:protein-tyrosine phosphatase [Desulfocicer vacuolatum DSM 3385]|uniref:protein-tyrosine-phosphatase n=1 Tax=Desulfocicer vacuolatum DSM 3385 TaxID=1121400 RepID=A0A1W1Z714_9BACT|nr:CpsB/CapC family capsule biosynthesis tyrosine phosphatase [Desulfocicer vacuolatum]SMC44156.1 protein-tyrosine phosphatase [Desulfocicer vacuolatum DSM 3385]
MIDFHSHILPCVDDGASSVEDAIKMAKMAVADGTSVMVATPHCCDGTYNCQKSDVLNGCRFLNSLLEEEQIPLTILPGQEIRLTPELLDDIDSGRVLTLNASAYILIELPTHVMPGYLCQIIRLVRSRGLIPVIAHPERNVVLMKNLDLLKEMHHCGALFQVTAGSLMGGFGRAVKKSATRLAHMDMVHFLGSDAHSANMRPPGIARARKRLEKLLNRPWEPHCRFETCQYEETVELLRA